MIKDSYFDFDLAGQKGDEAPYAAEANWLKYKQISKWRGRVEGNKDDIKKFLSDMGWYDSYNISQIKDCNFTHIIKDGRKIYIIKVKDSIRKEFGDQITVIVHDTDPMGNSIKPQAEIDIASSSDKSVNNALKVLKNLQDAINYAKKFSN